MAKVKAQTESSEYRVKHYFLGFDTSMPSIKVVSLEFGVHKFRKLSNLTIPIAPRITVIAGHNGVGKSTILALLAHPSGLTNRHASSLALTYTSANNTSYFDKTFQANFNEIVHIDHSRDYHQKLGPPKTLCEPAVSYLINSQETAVKACRLGPRPGPSSEDARMVARSIKPTTKTFTSVDGSITIGSSGKVPLPTIYLGMTRVLPVGEAEPGTASSVAKVMHADDAALVANFVNSVISGNNASAATITAQRIKNTGKMSGQPAHGFDARCVSLGQDSLGSIALALASFQKLKRDWPQYPGGLLIIDELDAGLHPHAIGALVKSLKSHAKALHLQIIATTHSPKLIEAVHPESEPLNTSLLDGVIYLRDTANPTLLQSPTLKQIMNDMALVPPRPAPKVKLPKLKIYFEDDEAAAVFKSLVPPAMQRLLGKKHEVKIEPMPLGVGCENLAALGEHDPYFKQVVMVLDADASANRANPKHAHIAKLPGDSYTGIRTGSENKDIINKPLAPERTLLQYVLNIVNKPDSHTATLVRLAAKDVTTDQLRVHMLDIGTNVLSKREQTKNWWKSRFQFIDDWGLLQEWAQDRLPQVAAFHSELDAAVATVAARIKK